MTKTKKEKVVKSAPKVIQWLCDNEYYCDIRGNWVKNNDYAERVFYGSLFRYCSKKPSENWAFPELIEERLIKN